MGLERDGLPPERRIWVSHFFSHFGSTQSQRQAFRDQLRAAGFGAGGEVASDEEVTGDGYWHHYAHTLIPASPETCRELDTKATEIAASHGVRYDLWHLARKPDGTLQDLSRHFAP